MMRKRQLGETDLELTTIGLGTWAIGGGHWKFGWGAQDEAEAVAARIDQLLIRRAEALARLPAADTGRV